MTKSVGTSQSGSKTSRQNGQYWALIMTGFAVKMLEEKLQPLKHCKTAPKSASLKLKMLYVHLKKHKSAVHLVYIYIYTPNLCFLYIYVYVHTICDHELILHFNSMWASAFEHVGFEMKEGISYHPVCSFAPRCFIENPLRKQLWKHRNRFLTHFFKDIFCSKGLFLRVFLSKN